MKEFKAILRAYKKVDFSQHQAALATVIRVHGSSYRSPGARMLITNDGHWVGSISGGCLEGDALRKARKVMSERKGMTVTYDTREESNQSLGIGLGCNGVIDVLIEPVDPQHPHNPITLFETFVDTQTPLAMATIFSGPSGIGKRFVVSQSGEIAANTSKELINDLLRLFETKRSETKAYQIDGTQVDIFLELIEPGITLILFGGGFDARPVSQLAKSLGWEVQVTDECIAHIAPIFFPEADKLSLCHRDFIDRDFVVTPYTACVLMSHNYEYDRDVLKKLAASEAPYIGILGPRKRFDKMLEEFSLGGPELSEEQIQRVHSPIGLDIGAEAPDEIALSIIAEIQTVFSNRSGGFLKNRLGPIHLRDTGSDQVFKQVYLKRDEGNKFNQ